MNTTILLGRLTAEPENIKGGARFNIAVDNGQDKNGNALTTFLQITVFGKLADFVMKWCQKGKRYLVTAHIINNNYEKNGQKVYSLTLIADRVEFADGKDATPPNGQNWQPAPPNGQNWQPAPPNGQNWQPVNNTELPFN
jgi:single-strand DNA-binding protein